jgi:N-acetylmuramoyl-L-alanine amidase
MYMKYMLLLTFIINYSVFAKIVLIDPGHGGDDCGAKAKIWKKTKNKSRLKVVCEKDIALNIAIKLKEFINNTKRHSAYLTRLTDKEVSLEKRSEMADKIKADIFISIHLNASTSKSSNGVETYYLDNHDDVAIKKVEMVENKDASGEEKVINSILADLVVQRVAPQSKELGKLVHKHLRANVIKRYKMQDRGIKPGLFYVLALSKRPAILLEAGFLTNGRESKLMSNHWFQRVYAKNVAKGIIEYLDKDFAPELF